MLTLTSITTTGVAEVHTASSTDLYRARNQYIEKYVGSTWVQQGTASGATADILSISDDGQTAYTFSYSGTTVKKTVDGGTTWSTVTNGSGTTLWGLMLGYVDGKVMFGTPAGAKIFNGSTWSTAAGVGTDNFKAIAGNASEMYALANGTPVVTKSVNGGANFSSFVTGAQIQSALFPTATDCVIQGLAFSNGKPLISVKVVISSVPSCRILKYTGSTWVEEAFTPTNSNNMSIFNSSTNLYCRETTGMGALTLWSTPYGAPSIPTEVTGVVTVANTGGTITLTQDMTVTATGDLTLDVAEVGNLAGGKTITVQPGGKIKLTAGRQATVLAGTLYKLLT